MKILVMAVAVAVVVALVAFAALWALNRPSTPAPEKREATPLAANRAGSPASPSASSTPSSMLSQNETVEVSITASGFSPTSVTIAQGQTVVFTNRTGGLTQVASDPHPAHTGLTGFDAKQAMSNGETYRFTFNSVGTFGYHDHLNVSRRGTVVVQQ